MKTNTRDDYWWRFRKKFPAIVNSWLLFTSALIGLVANPNAQPTVSFGIPEYAELGFVRESVQAGYEELSLDQLKISASLKFSDLALRAVTQSGDIANVSNGATGAAQLVGTLKQMADTVTAKNVGDLAGELSPIDSSVATASLSAIESNLQTLNSQISDPIQPPTLYVYYAAAVSGRARQIIAKMRDDAVSGRTSLGNTANNLGSLELLLDQYTANLRTANQLARALQAKLVEFLKIPLINVTVIYPLLTDCVAIEGQTFSLLNQVSSVNSRIVAAEQRVISRITELETLLTGLNYALTAPGLSSNWTTGADVGGANAYFNLSFSGTAFSHPYTEIDGPFRLGTLTIKNFRTPGTGASVSLSASINFRATRTVHDPLLGERVTSSSVTLPMGYVATTNDPDDPYCGSSRDFFSVPSLGANLFICEDYSRSFDVYAQYDSPLRIVAIEALPADFDHDPGVERFAFDLHVKNGTGTGVYSVGDEVDVSAQSISGYQFLHWEGDTNRLDDDQQAEATITMPNDNVNIEAVYTKLRPQFQLSVSNGTGSGEYAQGLQVGITAQAPQGLQFNRWIGDITYVQDSRAASTFITTAQNLNIEAEFIVPPNPLDLNSDGCIDRVDLTILTSKIKARTQDATYDINNDGKIDIADSRFLVLNFTNPGGAPCARP